MHDNLSLFIHYPISVLSGPQLFSWWGATLIIVVRNSSHSPPILKKVRKDSFWCAILAIPPNFKSDKTRTLNAWPRLRCLVLLLFLHYSDFRKESRSHQLLVTSKNHCRQGVLPEDNPELGQVHPSPSPPNKGLGSKEPRDQLAAHAS